VVVGFEIVEQHVDDHLKRDDYHCEEKVKQEILLFDTPFRCNRRLFVKLPNDKADERQIKDGDSLRCVVVICVDIIVWVDLVAFLSFYFIFSLNFFAFVVSLVLNRGFQLFFEKVGRILLGQPGYLSIYL
jgi:hypothetical protein